MSSNKIYKKKKGFFIFYLNKKDFILYFTYEKKKIIEKKSYNSIDRPL